nr:O-antigen ligase family protein [Actinomycetota bacterium]
GSDEERLAWIGGAAVVAVGAFGAALSLGLIPRPVIGRPAVAFLTLFSAVVAWGGISILWSIQPDRSWDYFNRELAYLAFLLLGVLVGALLPDAPRRVAVGLAVLIAAVLLWALAGKVFPSLGPDVTRNARLRLPVEYWNALALLGVTALVLSLWVVSVRRRAPALRAVGVVLTYVSMIAVVLTFSRGGIVIAALAIAGWLAVSRRVLETLGALTLAGVPALAVCAWAFAQPALTEEGQVHAARVREGRIFGALLVAGGGLVFGLAVGLARANWPERIPRAQRRALSRWALGAVAAALLAVTAAAVLRAGGPGDWAQARIDEFANPVSASLTQGSGRLAAASSNHRWTWWRESWDSFEENLLEGTGAGSFGLAHRVFRTEYSPFAREPHNVVLQTASETGLVGLVLSLAALAALVIAARRALRRLAGDERAAALALAVCGGAYLLHLLIDIGWDYAALTAPLLFALGVLVAAGGSSVTPGGRRWLPAAAVVGLAAAALLSLATPRLAEQRVDEAIDAISRSDLTAAAEAASDAHHLNPLSTDPLYKGAAVEELRGNVEAARRLYVGAVDLQPLDPETWYALGSFELHTAGDCRAAYDYLNRSWTLDRFGPAGERGGLLDRAREAVNAGRARC